MRFSLSPARFCLTLSSPRPAPMTGKILLPHPHPLGPCESPPQCHPTVFTGTYANLKSHPIPPHHLYEEGKISVGRSRERKVKWDETKLPSLFHTLWRINHGAQEVKINDKQPLIFTRVKFYQWRVNEVCLYHKLHLIHCSTIFSTKIYKNRIIRTMIAYNIPSRSVSMARKRRPYKKL